MAGQGTLTVKVLGDTQDFDGKMGGIGKTAGLAFAAVGAAGIAGAAKAVTAFAGFEQQMNEVFTLLPGISSQAMDDMSGQVKNFSKEFGVLPDEVVPALYQSLSAGVPQDNVFEFLETAQMAAKGGVTELTTAVDGISSVVNAYGSDVVSATQASDLMFTAVRLGKTNFEELSASLSNVTPIASGLGVGFEDISAALAAMTAKGTPTAQATTQLRSLFVELSKAGGATAATFEEMAGKTFQEFIAEGGNTAEALDIMKQAADESGVQLQDLFGSVEAGAAALSLGTGDAFTDNLEEMGGAAGATEAAFDQMMTGLGPIFDKMKANAAVFLIDVGQRLAPIVTTALETVTGAFDRLKEAVGPTLETIGGMAEQAFDILFRGDFKGGPFSEDSPIVDTLFNVRESLAQVAGIAEQAFNILFKGDFKGGPLAEDSGIVDTLFDIREAIAEVAGMAKQAFDVLFKGDFKGGPFSEDSPVIDALFTIRETVSALVERLGGASRVLKTFGVALGGLLAAKAVIGIVGGLAAVVGTLTGAVTALAGVLLSPIVILAAVGAALYLAYQNFEGFRNIVDNVAQVLVGTVWPAIQDFARLIAEQFGNLVGWVQDHWGAIQEAISHVVNVVAGIIRTTISALTALWQAWGDDLMNMVQVAWDFIRESIENGINFVRSTIETVLAIINGDWGDAWEGIKGMAAAVWDQIHNIVSTAINLVSSVLGGVLSTIGTLWSNAWDGMKNFLSDRMTDVKNLVFVAIEGIVTYFTELPGRLVAAAGDVFGFLVDTFKGALNTIIGLWNDFHIPSFTVGGWDTPFGKAPSYTSDRIDFPDIPEFDNGGIVPGRIGSPQLIRAHGGETVLPTHKLGRTAGDGITIHNHYPKPEPATDGTVRALRKVEYAVGG